MLTLVRPRFTIMFAALFKLGKESQADMLLDTIMCNVPRFVERRTLILNESERREREGGGGKG